MAKVSKLGVKNAIGFIIHRNRLRWSSQLAALTIEAGYMKQRL